MLMTQVDRYLAIRRAAGFALLPIEGYLRHFARFATARGETSVVATTAMAWATLAPSEAQRAYRLQTVIRFARFLHAEDPRHEIPPVGVFRGRRQRPTPYIFSDEAIQQLLRHASRLGPPGSLRPHTYSTLFGLLAVTGMRVAEARNLLLQDVTADGLLIRETKFHKSRLLPLHATTRAALDRYLYRRHRMAGLDTYLFVTRRGGPLSRTVVTHLEQSRRVLAIPTKKTAMPLVTHFSMPEMHAILDAPDGHTRAGIRDRAMLHLCFAAGLRVSELLTLPLTAITFHPTPAVRVLGKGRRARSLPLWKRTADVLQVWLGVRGDVRAPELFPNAQGRVMTREGFAYVLRKYVRLAAPRCPSLGAKQVTPPVLRHTCAMMILQATGDLRKVSLWLVHADMQTTEL